MINVEALLPLLGRLLRRLLLRGWLATRLLRCGLPLLGSHSSFSMNRS